AGRKERTRLEPQTAGAGSPATPKTSELRRIVRRSAGSARRKKLTTNKAPTSPVIAPDAPTLGTSGGLNSSDPAAPPSALTTKIITNHARPIIGSRRRPTMSRAKQLPKRCEPLPARRGPELTRHHSPDLTTRS